MSKKKIYVIGTNVDKSLSPLIFNHWFKKYKINAIYDFRTIKEKNFNKEINEILKEKNLCGLNVTIPFKEKILKKMDKLDKASKIIRAVNCVTIRNNKYYGSNTDWVGFGEALLNAMLEQQINITKNGKVILIGYGGAAKAVLYNLSLMGAVWKNNTLVFNRSKRKINIPFISQKTTLSLSKIQNYLNDAFLIINTTPRNTLADLKIKKINREVAVCDIVYKPKETKFLKHFTKPSAKIYGIHMLINQARPCFFEWFGVRPSEDEALTNKLLKEISK